MTRARKVASNTRHRVVMIAIAAALIASTSPSLVALRTDAINIDFTHDETRTFVLSANRIAGAESGRLHLHVKALDPCGSGGRVTLTSDAPREPLSLALLPTSPRDGSVCAILEEPSAEANDAGSLPAGAYPGEGDLDLATCDPAGPCERRITLHVAVPEPDTLLQVTLMGVADPPPPSGCGDDDHVFSDGARIRLVEEGAP